MAIMQPDKTPDDAAAEMKNRLRADLRIAMKEGRPQETKVLRALIAALDNAEAPPVDLTQAASPQQDFQSGTAEVERLLLGSDRIHVLLLAEIQEREHAAAELEHVGQTAPAEALRAEAAIARRYLE